MVCGTFSVPTSAMAGHDYDLPDEPFAEEGVVAYVGNDGYEFLEDAIDDEEASPENPIVIVDDVLLTSTLTISKPVTIISDGVKDHTISAASRAESGDMIVINSIGVRFVGYENANLVFDGRASGTTETTYAGSIMHIKADGFVGENLSLCYGYTSGVNAGGALYVEAANASFTDCYFYNNKYTSANGSYGGGVLQLKGADGVSASFTDCYFADNYADQNGGVANICGRSQASFTGCSFSANESVKVGGAFYVGQANSGANPGVLSLSNCEFTANKAGTNGAAIRATGSFIIDKCTFTANVANDSSSTAGGDISVGNAYSVTRSINNSTFDKACADAVKSSASNGLTTITPSDLFSTNDFDDDYIAKLGDKSYKTFNAALTAAKAGDTIELLADCSEDITFSKRVTITGNFQLSGTIKINAAVTLDGASFAGNGTSIDSTKGGRAYSIRRNDAHDLLDALPAYTGGDFVSYNIGYAEKGSKATQEVIYKGTLEKYEAYIDNFDCDNTGEIGRLHYAHAVYGTTSVYMYYDSFTGHVKIVAEPTSLSGSIAKQHSKTGSYTPSVTMINCTNSSDVTNSKYGMCLIYQLSDGSFIIVDGGYYNEGSKIYNKLVELAGSESNIKISAWLLTHAHNDHVRAIRQFIADHPTLLPENIIANFVADFEYSDPNAACPEYRVDATSDRTEKVAERNSTKSLIKNNSLNFVKAHAGDAFNIGDATIEVICTHENYKPMMLLNINETSTIFRITLAGETTMILGDASRFAEYYLNNVIGSALASDGVTLAHHGYATRGVTSALYANINPSFALWPVAENAYNDTYSANAWVLNNVDKVYVAKDYGSSVGWAKTISFGKTVTMSASIKGDFSVNFGVSDLSGFDSARLYAKLGDKDAMSLDGTKNGTSFNFTYDEIYSQYMTDELSCKVYATKRGVEYYICEFTTTLANYINQIVSENTLTQNEKEFYSNILKMGAESQKYSGHRSSNTQLATYGISWLCATDTDPADSLRSATAKPANEAYISSATLSVGYKLSQIFTIFVPSGVSTDGLTVKVNGEAVTLANPTVKANGTAYTVTVTDILPYNYDQATVVTLYRSGSEVHKVTYSVNSFLKAKASDNTLKGLVRAIYNYGAAAEKVIK